MVSWGAPGMANARCFSCKNARHACSKRKRPSAQCGVQTIEVTPACIAAESIIKEPDMVRGPLSNPGRIWLCTSRMALATPFVYGSPSCSRPGGACCRYLFTYCIIGAALPLLAPIKRLNNRLNREPPCRLRSTKRPANCLTLPQASPTTAPLNAKPQVIWSKHLPIAGY